ncbi:MAG: Fic family protein, partial [Anaerolineae bacterium]|nr:Fic family protein [Anaerolineae bacterium]
DFYAGGREVDEGFTVYTLWGEIAYRLGGVAQALRPVERAALAHHRLAAVHPFIDGNGRTARLVMNLLLLRDGCPPTIILCANRRQYYRALAQADGGKTTPLLNIRPRRPKTSEV